MKAIVAMDPNRVIGCNGKIPWHISDDLKWFKKMTTGQALVMGRSTFESLGGRPLPNRFTYILTRDQTKLAFPEGKFHQFIDKDTLLKKYDQDYGWQFLQDYLWICGGAKVYAEFLPYIKEIYVTHLADDYEGDAFMPEFEPFFDDYKIITEAKNYTIVKYKRTKWGTPTSSE